MGDVLNIPPLAAQDLAKMSARADAASPEEADKDRKLRKACADFEAIFISYIFQTMRKAVPENSYMGKMPGKDTYTMMMDHKLSEDLARKGGGIGLQKVLYEQMKRIPLKAPQLEGDGVDTAPATKKALKVD
ncbi:MAG TPA: rod-binding protein [Syntrophales bacterium]|nr:rod-binding protein [Syntrophales bacterium]